MEQKGTFLHYRYFPASWRVSVSLRLNPCLNLRIGSGHAMVQIGRAFRGLR